MLSRHAQPTVDEGVGIIVLSMNRQVLHASQSALGWAGLLGTDGPSRAPMQETPRFPQSLHDFSQHVLIHLEKRIAAENYAPFEMKQVLHAADGGFLLRGFGIPDKTQRQRSRILLTLQPLNREPPE